VLNEKYGLETDRLTTFIDSYHGLKSKAGDTHVANCASCHGVHRILPSSDPTSTINPENLQTTCGECHPNISAKMASNPIHGVSGEGLRTPLADVVQNIYIVAIVVIIGLMVVHWLIDLWRHIKNLDRLPAAGAADAHRRGDPARHSRDRVHRAGDLRLCAALRPGHHRRLFFGWTGGFQIRGTVHRVFAVIFMGTVAWHAVFLTTARGREFVKDMFPVGRDFKFFLDRALYNLGLRDHTRASSASATSRRPSTGPWCGDGGHDHHRPRALVRQPGDPAAAQRRARRGAGGALLEAWLATLAILIWHMYSTVFNPHVYPMNPSWLTGTMPEEMYHHEHPGHLEEAKRRPRRRSGTRSPRCRASRGRLTRLRARTSRPSLRTTPSADGGRRPDSGTGREREPLDSRRWSLP